MHKTIAIIHFAPESGGCLGLARLLACGITHAITVVEVWVTQKVFSLTCLALGLRKLRQQRAGIARAFWTSPLLYVVCRVATLLTWWLKAPRRSVSRGTSRGCRPFCSNLALKVTQCHFHSILLTRWPQMHTQIEENTGSTSWLKECQRTCGHVLKPLSSASWHKRYTCNTYSLPRRTPENLLLKHQAQLRVLLSKSGLSVGHASQMKFHKYSSLSTVSVDLKNWGLKKQSYLPSTYPVHNGEAAMLL